MFLTFIAATSLMIALPGPSILLTVAHSLSFGWRYSLYTAMGATIGVSVQLLIATIGLASLLNTAAEAFNWLRWGGALYLIYLGIKQWQSASKPIEVLHASVSKANLIFQGIIVTIPNPKSLIFIAAFLPQFIDSSQPLGMQLVYIVPTFLLISFVVTAFWGLVAGKANIFLRSQKAIQSALRAAGGIMVVAGFGLALARRNT